MDSKSTDNLDCGRTGAELQPIRDKVYSHLKNAILRGEYKAGDRLVERNLAEKLNISRTPIREALFRLESQKFVSTLPRKGVVVNEISRDEILELFMILSSLEPMAVRLAATKIDAETRRECDQVIGELKAIKHDMGEIDEQDAHVEHNRKYNDFIGKASKNTRLYNMVMELKDQVWACTSLRRQMQGRAREVLGEHLNILTAVRDNQWELAEKYASIHIEKTRQAYIQSNQASGG